MKVENLEIDKKTAISVILKTFLALVFPFFGYGRYNTFSSTSMLFRVVWNLNDNVIGFQLLPDVEILFPALLILIPCVLWETTANRLTKQSFLKSIVFVLLILMVILSIFLPWWYFLSPLLGSIYAAVIPRYLDLNPFASLVFLLFVYIPILLRILSTNESNFHSIRIKAILPLLIAIAIFAPIIIEFTMWQSSLGVYLFTAIYYMWWGVNSSGQITELYFSIISIPQIAIWSLISIPGLLFAYYVLQIVKGEEKLFEASVTGFTQICILIDIASWNNYITTQAGTWNFIPCPCSVLIGFIIIIITRWRLTKNQKHYLISNF